MTPEEEKSLKYLEYEERNGEIVITGYVGNQLELAIPSQIDGLPVTAIGEQAFNWCIFLESVTLPEGLTSIGNTVFFGCEFLNSVTLPASLREISGNPFNYCGHLTVLHLSPDHPYFQTKNGVLFSRDGQRLICYPRGKEDTCYEVPEGVTAIEESAFSGCGSLTSVTFSEGLTSIGKEAFRGCESLMNVTLPEGLTSIGEDAFSVGQSLTRDMFPVIVMETEEETLFEPKFLKTVYGKKGSVAEEWAKENGVEFVAR